MSSSRIAILKQSAIGAGFRMFRSTGAHRVAARWTGGRGAILMFHRVRPWTGGAFAPNRLLEITPEFLAETIETLLAQGFDILPLDAALARISQGGGAAAKRFAVLTFDDGYRDNLEFALPVLQRYRAPFTVYVAPGFADRTVGLWWVELEEAVRRGGGRLDIGGRSFSLSDSNDSEKTESFNSLYWLLRALPEHEMRAAIRTLAEQARVDWCALVADACLGWEGLAELAADPLCTIGAHTMTHPMLAKLPEAEMRAEIAESRDAIERRLGVRPRHFAYPVGDPGSAGPREFAVAAELGFASAVTTRPGMVFAEHAESLTALPRLSVNGNWQDRSALEVLLSGAPFALWNRGRKVNAA
ncbi:MAG: polysaccharide deacetylase family protein [Beijerinckiaceae bacterium]